MRWSLVALLASTVACVVPADNVGDAGPDERCAVTEPLCFGAFDGEDECPRSTVEFEAPCPESDMVCSYCVGEGRRTLQCGFSNDPVWGFVDADCFP
jgi:hypothetical protein